MEFLQKWDGTAAGATPIIDWIHQSGGTARYHDASDVPGARTEIVVDTPDGSAVILPGTVFVLAFVPVNPSGSVVQRAVDEATANPGRTVFVEGER